jgi:alpha/beta superfamily hydrolase
MQEESVHFSSGQWQIEGLYRVCDSGKGVVITHPHPLYGGDMFNPVVEAIADAYRQKGFATLRFNFRGSGRSTGTHDQGIGERVDVARAVEFMKRNDADEIYLSGYSFGSYVNAMAMQTDLTVAGMTMVAPPVAFIEFADDLRLPQLSTVVVGERDEFAPPGMIRPLLEQWNPHARMSIIHDADHFFFGFLDEVTRRLAEHV